MSHNIFSLWDDPSLLHILWFWKFISKGGGSLAVCWFKERKGPPWKTPHLLLPCLDMSPRAFSSVSTATQESPCLFYPEHCPKYPVPTFLSGVGDFAKRFFFLSVPYWDSVELHWQVLYLHPWGADLSSSVRVQHACPPTPISHWISEAPLPLSRVIGIKRGCVRLIRTTRFPFGRGRCPEPIHF